MNDPQRPAFLYIMDPLCGWCYGFSPVVTALYEAYHSAFDFRVISGGMITGARVAPVSEMAGYILNAYKRVEEYTGVVFGEPYLDRLREGVEMNDSEPGCRAMHTASQLAPDRALQYAHLLQKAIFLDGESWNDVAVFASVAAKLGIDRDMFSEAWSSEVMRYGTQQEFQWVQAAGITGFPCSVLQKEDQYYLLAQGYQPPGRLRSVIGKVMAGS